MSKPWETIRDGSVSVPIYRQRQAHTVTHTVTWYECGKRARKSFSDPAKAREHARKIARGLSQLGSSSLTITGEELLAYSRARQMIPGEAIDAAIVELVHNGLRHSFGTYRMALVQSEQQVALEMGNSPQMIFRHYRAVATREQAEEWFGVVRK